MDGLQDLTPLAIMAVALVWLARVIYTMVTSKRSMAIDKALKNDCFTDKDREAVYDIKNSVREHCINSKNDMNNLGKAVEKMIVVAEKQHDAIKENTGSVRLLTEIIKKNGGNR